jgi:hypothetical protein
MSEEILRLQITGPHTEEEYEVEVNNAVGHKETDKVTFVCPDKKSAMQLHNALLFNTSAFVMV